MRNSLRVVALLLAGFAASAAQAGAVVKIDDDNWINIGAQIQPAVRFQSDGKNESAKSGLEAVNGGLGSDFYLRRVRLLTNGQIGKDVSWTFNVDMPNLGAKSDFLQQFYVFEAFISYQFAANQYVDMGFFLLPYARGWIGSSAQIHPLELHSPVLTLFGSDKGNRQVGVQYRANLLDKALNVRFAVTNGAQGAAASATADARNPADIPAFSASARYYFMGAGKEAGFSVPGIQFSETPIVALGVAGYFQKEAGLNIAGVDSAPKNTAANYTAIAGDFHVEWPFDKDNEIVAEVGVSKTNAGAGQANTTLGIYAEAGYRFGMWEPVLTWEFKNTDDQAEGTVANSFGANPAGQSGFRAFRVGLNMWVMKHKFNVKAEFALTRTGKIGQSTVGMDKVAIIQSQILF